MKCIEWFSGIGGMKYALNISGVKDVQVVASFDINQIANQVYYHNFHRHPETKNIEYLSVEYIDKFGANVWLMSPPCQPFTQGGKQRDDKDVRSAGFLHLISLLEKLKNVPDYIFLENVPFFETSNCHQRWIQVLKRLDFEIEEYMITPTDPVVGIPNRRKRYYLSARKKRHSANLEQPFIEDHIITSFSELGGIFQPCASPRPLASYVKEENDPQYLVPIPFIQSAKDFKFGYCYPCHMIASYFIDIVKSDSLDCSTFTKAYGSKYVIGTGSYLQTKNLDLDYEPDDQTKLPLLGLRFFTPTEIADLHGLPLPGSKSTPDEGVFEFPQDISLIQKYRLLGNSLNVRVVAYLLKRLFSSNI